MADISMRRALTGGFAVIRAAPLLVASYIAIGIAVPLLLFSIHAGSNFRTFYALIAFPGVSVRTAGSALTIASLFALTGVGLTCVAFAAWNALLSDSRDGYAGEIMYGVVGGLIGSLTSAVIYVGAQLPFSLVAIPLGFLARSAQGGPVATYALPVIQFVSFATLVWVNARLCLSGPVMAATGSVNPVIGLAQSWQLTAPCQWRVLALLLPFQIAAFLALIAIIALGVYLVEGSSDFGWQDWVVTAAWTSAGMGFMLLFLIVSIGLCRELMPRTNASIFD